MMLALLEHEVTRRGGTYAMEDTDSMAIVATEDGGLVECPAGPERFPDCREAVKALTRQLYCFAISAKRYALFVLDGKGQPTITKASEHGLGHLLNPTDLDDKDRKWIPRVWLNIVRRALGLRTRPLPFEQLPAIGRVTISSPAVMRPLSRLNFDKPYTRQLKPFNFLLTCHVRAFGHPTGVDPERFHLIAPYESDPARWTELEWIDQYSGKSSHITTAGHHGGRGIARIKTYRDVFEKYKWHPKSKCADVKGQPANRQTVGLLQRRHVRIEGLKYIGKESSFVEEVDSGAVHSSDAVYTEYPDPRRDEWSAVRDVLWKIPLATFEEMTGKSRRRLIDARSGRREPHPDTRDLLASVARRLGLIRWKELSVPLNESRGYPCNLLAGT